MGEVLNAIDSILNNFGYYIDFNNIPTIAFLIAGIIISVVICFFGLKVKRVLGCLSGMFIGVAVGAGVILGFNLSGTLALVVAIASVVIFGILSAVFVRIGVFILMLVYTMSLGIAVLPVTQVWALAISGGVAVLIAILAAIFMDPFIIIVTGLMGGLSIGQYVGTLINQESNLLLVYGISAGMAVVGIIIQFMMHSKKKIRQEKDVVEKVRESSLETEVEKARNILDEESSFDDEDENSDLSVHKKDDEIEFIDIDD
ncbi:MAG: hypothetical protein ACK5LL_00655 [Suipraeoptans sp.]